MKPPLRLLPWLLACGVLCAATPSAFALRATARQVTKEVPSPAEVSLASARRAQALLGPTTWSRLIRVANVALRSAYPVTVYALVFEEAGILWFYTDTDGTQSFSLHPERLAEEKSDFTPLLLAIDAGFAAYEVVASDVARVSGPVIPENGPGGPFSLPERELPNGCFIESLAALRECISRGEPIERARLLSYYVDTPAGRRGHTILTYETPRGLFLLDAARSREPQAVPRAWADDAMALASVAWQGAKIARARWVPTALPSSPTLLASLDSSTDPVPGAAPRLMR